MASRTRMLEFDRLRGLAIVAVIIVHSTVHNMEFSNTIINESILVFLNMISRFAIASFFFISGFFITHQEVVRGEPTSKIIYSRIKRTVPPYVLWSIIYYSLFIITGEAYATHQSLPLIFVEKLVTGTVSFHLFFKITILQYYIMCLWGMGKKGQIGRFTWILFGGMQLLFIIINYFALFKNEFRASLIYALNLFQAYCRSTFPMFILFFLFGRWVGADYEKFIKKFEKWRRLIFIVFLVSFAAALVEFLFLKNWQIGGIKLPQNWQITANLYAFSFIIYMIICLRSLKYGPIDWALMKVAKVSFILYLLHEPLLGYLTKFIHIYTPLGGESQLVIQPILLIGSIGICVVIYKSIERVSPKYVRSLLLG